MRKKEELEMKCSKIPTFKNNQEKQMLAPSPEGEHRTGKLFGRQSNELERNLKLFKVFGKISREHIRRK